MKITVFGGSGFLGSHVSDKLSESGNEVTIADRNPSPWLKDGQKMLVGDVTDKDFVLKACQGAEVVFDFAGIADLGDANKSPEKTARINILGTINILEACVEAQVKRVIFASSMYVYGQHGGFYRCSKQASELFIEEFHKQFGLSYTILRYGSLYGPRADKRNGIYNFLYNAITKNKINYYGSPRAMREYINVEDAAISTVEVLKPEFANSILILTGSQLMRIEDIFNMISEIMGIQLEINYEGDENSHHYSLTPYRYMPGAAKKMYPALTTDFGHGLIQVIEQVYSDLSHDGGKCENEQ